MSRIDVSELLTDPDFVDEVIQIKRGASVNARGEEQTSEVPIKTIGCVQPASGRTIFRLPEAERVENVSEFFIRGVITASAPGKYTDILMFKGQRYQVQRVFDWSNWGAGYCEGTCIQEVPA